MKWSSSWDNLAKLQASLDDKSTIKFSKCPLFFPKMPSICPLFWSKNALYLPSICLSRPSKHNWPVWIRGGWQAQLAHSGGQGGGCNFAPFLLVEHYKRILNCTCRTFPPDRRGVAPLEASPAAAVPWSCAGAQVAGLPPPWGGELSVYQEAEHPGLCPASETRQENLGSGTASAWIHADLFFRQYHITKAFQYYIRSTT